jgi:hypothetical protein
LLRGTIAALNCWLATALQWYTVGNAFPTYSA